MTRMGMCRTALVAAYLLVASLSAMTACAAPANAVVDLQFSLCDTPKKIIQVFDLRQHGASFDVWLFDDEALGLFTKGLRIRLRQTRQGAELTLKAADQDCTMLAPGTLPAGQGKCEYDQHGTKMSGALSLTRAIDKRTANELIAGRQLLANQFSTAQKNFLQGVPGAWPLPFGTHALGPTHVRSYRTKSGVYAVDVSELPGGERFVEISRKVAKTDSPSAREQFEADLAKVGA